MRAPTLTPPRHAFSFLRFIQESGCLSRAPLTAPVAAARARGLGFERELRRRAPLELARGMRAATPSSARWHRGRPERALWARRRGLRARVQSGALGPGRADPQSPDRNPRLGAGVLAGSARTARTARLGGERPGPRALGRRALRAGEVARLLGPLGASAVLQPSTFLTSTHSAQPYLTKIF
jgi:hypothetical protein